MGFRDLESFNVALLARQGWRLLKEPNSLLARLLKSRYFPSSSVLEAGSGYQPSYAWRSLLRGIGALRAGIYWNIGNGATISTITDAWLPRPNSFRPICLPAELDESSKVIDLIDWTTGGWREDVIRRLFIPCDADFILNIHLIDPGIQDEITWFYEPSGSFSVKSCYHLLVKRADQLKGRGDSSSRQETNSFWTNIWKIKIPPRIRAFAWRCATNTLPCKSNLLRRHCVEDDICFVCGGVETISHVLFDCPRAQGFWRRFPRLRKMGGHHPGFEERLEVVMDSSPADLVEEWIMLAHVVWSTRNTLLFEGIEKEAEIVIDNQLRWLAEFKRSSARSNKHGVREATGDRRWRKPPMGFIKINVDAAVSDGGCGVGLIARDDSGEVCFMGAKRIQQGSEPAIAEAEGVLWAVQNAVEQGLTHVIIEADCLVIIHRLQKRKIDRNVLGKLVGKILQVASELDVVTWRFARRNANAGRIHLLVLNLSIYFLLWVLWSLFLVYLTL